MHLISEANWLMRDALNLSKNTCTLTFRDFLRMHLISEANWSDAGYNVQLVLCGHCFNRGTRQVKPWGWPEPNVCNVFECIR
jgi:hypothetical protein